jgi:DNA mismatch repair protein MutS
VLFATHHHDLTALADDLAEAFNLHFRTRHADGEVVFKHTVERGSAAASYGVEVAAAAGVPEEVVRGARSLLAEDRLTARTGGHASSTTATDAVAGDRARTNGHRELPTSVRRRLSEMDVATMTPLEALNTLAELQRELE